MPTTMPGHDIIVIGASAGGVEAILHLVEQLPPGLPAAVFIVLHISPLYRSVLPSLLDRRGPLPAAHAQDGEPIESGRIYVAPPDYHLILQPNVVRVQHGPHENGVRPAADVLFRSAARAYGPRVVGVVLSGMLDDGTAGLEEIKQNDGIAIVQDPAEALFAGMPKSAVDNVAVDYILPLAQIAAVLAQLAADPMNEGEKTAMPQKGIEPEAIVHRTIEEQEDGKRDGQSSVFTCPDCGGVVWEQEEGGILRYRCHVGHVYSSESFLAGQADRLEEALWTAVRTLEESAFIHRRLATRLQKNGSDLSAQRFRKQAETTHQHADLIRQVLDTLQPAARIENKEYTKQEKQHREKTNAETIP